MPNVAFCEPGTTVYALVPAAYPNACFYNLAYVYGLGYWADQFHGDGAMVEAVREVAIQCKHRVLRQRVEAEVAPPGRREVIA